VSKQISLITGTYTQSQIANHLKHFGSNGYVFNYLDEFEVVPSSPEAMTVSVKAGGSFIEGYYYEEDAASTINIPAAHATLNRIDRIVLRLTPLSAPYAQIAVISGTEAASPTAPALTQTSVTYELSLAQVYVGAAVVAIYTANITDERDTTYCGAASSLQTASGSLLYSDTLPTLYGSDTDFPVSTANYGIGVTDGDHTGWVIGADTTENKVYEMDSDVSPISWTAKTNITTPRTSGWSYQPRGIYYDGKIYVIGGYAAGVVTDKNEALDPVANTWASLTAITTPRYGFGIAEYDGDIYCIGGRTTGNAFTAKNEAYNVLGNSWSPFSDLPTTPSAGDTVAVYLNGYIWILYKDAGAVKFYRYDPSTDAYTAKTAPSDAVRLGTLASNGVLVYKERLWAFDGYIWLSSEKYLFRYDPSSNVWLCVSETFFCYNSSGATYRLGNNQVHRILQFGDKRFVCPNKYSSNNNFYTYWYTYYMYLGQVSADKLLAFRQRSSAKIDLINISSQTAGEAVYCMSTDKYGVYYDQYTSDVTQVIQVYG
jgi:hypothetical protein